MDSKTTTDTTPRSPTSTSARSLLAQYRTRATVNASAHKLAERYRLRQYHWLTYPVIFISSAATLLAGGDSAGFTNDGPVTGVVLTTLSFLTMILTSFHSKINPADKRAKHAAISAEYAEIANEIGYYLESGKKSTDDEDIVFANEVKMQLNIWDSLAPLIKPSLMERARRDTTMEAKHAIQNASLEPKRPRRADVRASVRFHLTR